MNVTEKVVSKEKVKVLEITEEEMRKVLSNSIHNTLEGADDGEIKLAILLTGVLLSADVMTNLFCKEDK